MLKTSCKVVTFNRENVEFVLRFDGTDSDRISFTDLKVGDVFNHYETSQHKWFVVIDQQEDSVSSVECNSKPGQVFALKFREKGSKTYRTVFIHAQDQDHCGRKFHEEVLEDLGLDVDKRTISWAGGSIPFMHTGGVETIYTNLDEIH